MRMVFREESDKLYTTVNLKFFTIEGINPMYLNTETDGILGLAPENFNIRNR
jgi:hypothetical protein